jgi:small subunit ribosomal protein S4
MPRRKHKKYTKPKRPFDKTRIDEENALIKKYGLKNKREIWKAESEIANIRNQAKLLLTKSEKEQEKFVTRLAKQGFAVASIADVLALDKEDYLKRRLQSIMFEKKMSTTPKQARQFIVHKHVSINKEKINIPSYMVPIEEEDKIQLTLVKKEKEKNKTEKTAEPESPKENNEEEKSNE